MTRVDGAHVDEFNDNELVAQETIAILRAGHYVAPSGKLVSLSGALEISVRGTFLVRAPAPVRPALSSPRVVDVTTESTAVAARRLATRGMRTGILNFANSMIPGGGFLEGSRAQEEQLCRCSTLYAALDSQRDDVRAFYRENEVNQTALAHDLVLVTPEVVFFRDEDFTLLETPFAVTVLTGAAPDLGWLHAVTDMGVEPRSRYADVPGAFQRRTRLVLHAAAAAGVEALVLGAWGCGAFHNDPQMVASAFFEALAEDVGAFKEVVFAMRGSKGPNHAAFTRVFGVTQSLV